ncbi:MAG: sortase [bacterium]|nr:sortase [bacterium]
MTKPWLEVISTVLIILGSALLLAVIAPQLIAEFRYQWRQFLPPSSLSVPEPASFDFGLIIDKIGVNVPIVAKVDVSKKEVYQQALRSGVAHALGSSLPNQEAGTTFLFAHSSMDFWALGKYATVFNLLPKMEVGDPITILYQGEKYHYRVTKKEIVRGFETKFSNSISNQPPLVILQTCYPIGTTLNRLLVTASFVGTS